MRILLASDHYPPFIGGAQRQAQLLAEGMADRGHEVSVVTTWSGGLPTVRDENGVVVHRLKQMRTAVSPLARDGGQSHQPPFPDPVTTWGMRRLIASLDPDLVHSYGWITYSAAAALIRKKVPLLVTARDYASFCATRTLMEKGSRLCSGPGVRKCLECAGAHYGAPKGWLAAAAVGMWRPLLKGKTSAFHGVSSFVTEAHHRHLFESINGDRRRPREITLPDLRGDVRGERTDPGEPHLERYLSKLPQDPFILFVGAFRRVKGLETIFSAYRRLSQPPPLVLIGTFESDTPPFPPEATVLTDVPHAAVMAVWDRALFGVMPSIWPEPFAGTIHEAMSRGKPVISTRIGGSTDMIDETNGILVPPGDDRALADAMAALIHDEARRELYGRAAAHKAEAFTAAAVLPRFERIYREVIAGERGIGEANS